MRSRNATVHFTCDKCTVYNSFSYRIKTGNVEHPGDIFSNASIEILTTENKLKREKSKCTNKLFLKLFSNKTIWPRCFNMAA